LLTWVASPKLKSAASKVADAPRKLLSQRSSARQLASVVRATG